MTDNPGAQPVVGGDEEPTEATAAALALCFMRSDVEGAEATLNNTNLPLLVGASFAWFNGVLIGMLGREGAERWLIEFLTEAAQTREG
jgi:hypothetical protein